MPKLAHNNNKKRKWFHVASTFQNTLHLTRMSVCFAIQIASKMNMQITQIFCMQCPFTTKLPYVIASPFPPHAPLSIQPTGTRPASTFTYVLTGRKWQVVLIIGTPFTTGCNPSIRIIETPSNNLEGFQGACGGRARGGICNIENYLDGLFHEDNDKLM